jgi:hypothetical protein
MSRIKNYLIYYNNYYKLELLIILMADKPNEAYKRTIFEFVEGKTPNGKVCTRFDYSLSNYCGAFSSTSDGLKGFAEYIQNLTRQNIEFYFRNMQGQEIEVREGLEGYFTVIIKEGLTNKELEQLASLMVIPRNRTAEIDK